MSIILPLITGVVIFLLFTDKPMMLLAHGLNTLFKLPHPGPNDIQGCCWCRRHEGPPKYTFSDYLNSRLKIIANYVESLRK